jgi:phosphatidate cytidylyltransferase
LGEKFEKIKIRTLTIVIGIPIVLYIIHIGGMVFNLTIAIFAIIALIELHNIFKKKYNPSFLLGILLTLFFLFKRYLLELFPINNNLFFTILLLLIFAEHSVGNSNKKNMVINIGITLFIAIYIGHFLSFLVDIRNLPNGKIFIIFSLFATWMNDTFAYLFGVNFGKKHIFPNISPNKTLEGSIGGLLGGLFCGILFYILIVPSKGFMLIIFGLIAAICGQAGDLFESIIKRNFNVKDSGTILPGHGGILDCMDSILFSAPVLYFLLTYFI